MSRLAAAAVLTVLLGTAVPAAEPELVVLKELPGGVSLTAPWLSADGLTLYWATRTKTMQRAVWTATRKDPGAGFENAREVAVGVDPTVSADGRELIFYGGPGGLRVCTRKAPDGDFSPPRLAPGLATEPGTNLFAPCLADDRTLYADHLSADGVAVLRYERANRKAAWGQPERVTFKDSPATTHRTVFVSTGGKYALCTGGNLQGDNLLYFTSRDGGKTFDSPTVLKLPGQPLTGEFPRYCEATKELIFNRNKDGMGSREIVIVRNFDLKVKAQRKK
jgi:hypothetical protein